MKSSKLLDLLVSGGLIAFFILPEVRGQLEVTITIHDNSNVLRFPPSRFEDFLRCMCSRKVTCSISFNQSNQEYIVSGVIRSNDVGQQDRAIHYICDYFTFDIGQDLDCNLRNINACNGLPCSAAAYVESSCPCLGIQWMGFEVYYSGTCGEDGPCDDNLVPNKDPETCSSSDANGEDNDNGGGSGEAGESSDNNQAVAIGAGLGSALVIVIIIAAIALYIIWRRKKQANQHADKTPAAQPNSYVRSQMSNSGNRKSVVSNHEDNYGYTDYVEPGSTYYEIGEDGELAACRDEEVGSGTVSNAAGKVDDRIGSEGDGYNKLNAVKNISEGDLPTYNRAAGRLEDGLRVDKPSEKATKGESASYSMARSINGQNTNLSGGNGAPADSRETGSSPAPGIDYFVLEAEEDGKVAMANSHEMSSLAMPGNDYFVLEAEEDNGGEEDKDGAGKD